MIAGTPDIKTFFETLDECVDCKFNEKFSKYADYLSIAKIEDTQYIGGKPIIKNVDYLARYLLYAFCFISIIRSIPLFLSSAIILS